MDGLEEIRDPGKKAQVSSSNWEEVTNAFWGKPDIVMRGRAPT